MIRIVNLKNYKLNKDEVLIKVDRSNKILGNKFYMANESTRDLVCNQYREWFKEQIKMPNSDVLVELRSIYTIAKSNDISLGCWCAPKRCHAETIKAFLDKFLVINIKRG
jgi:hypothetical protein